MACHDPCLEPCDKRNDCCCHKLQFTSEVLRNVVGDCNQISGLSLRWTRIPDCVLARAGVGPGEDLEIKIHLVCPESGDDGADYTFTFEVDEDSLGGGGVVISRQDLFGSAPGCDKCISSLALSPCLTVSLEGKVVLRCPACPAGCDELLSASGSSGDESGGSDGEGASSGGPGGGDDDWPGGSDGPDGGGGPSGTGDPPTFSSDDDPETPCRCRIIAAAAVLRECSIDGTDLTADIAVSAAVALTDCDCANTACNGFWRIRCGTQTYLGAGLNGHEHIFTSIPCEPGGVFTITFEWAGVQGAVQGIRCAVALEVTV